MKSDPDEIFEALKAEFTDDELEWKVQTCGKSGDKVWALIVPYIQSRAIMDRLDEVVGINNWQDKYRDMMGSKVTGCLCELSIRINNEWITKSDGSDFTNIEAIKGGISGALKRAAVKFGIGRYLYNLPVFWANGIKDGYPDKNQKNTISINSKEKKIVSWCPAPELSKGNTGTPPPADDKPPASAKKKPSEDQLNKISELLKKVNWDANSTYYENVITWRSLKTKKQFLPQIADKIINKLMDLEKNPPKTGDKYE